MFIILMFSYILAVATVVARLLLPLLDNFFWVTVASQSHLNSHTSLTPKNSILVTYVKYLSVSMYVFDDC